MWVKMKNGWGLIGNKTSMENGKNRLWHCAKEIRSDFGDTIQDADIIRMIVDTDAHTLSFQCLSKRKVTGTWGLAFENLPPVTLFPAVSVFEKGDSVRIIGAKDDVKPVHK
jgi:hypothetical protein